MFFSNLNITNYNHICQCYKFTEMSIITDI